MKYTSDTSYPDPPLSTPNPYHNFIHGFFKTVILAVSLTFASVEIAVSQQTAGPFEAEGAPGIEWYQTTATTIDGSNIAYEVDYRLVNTTASSVSFYYKLGFTGDWIPLTLAPGSDITTATIADAVPSGGYPDVGIYFSQDGADSPDIAAQAEAAALINSTLNESIDRVSKCVKKAQKATKKSPSKGAKALKKLSKCLKKEDPEKKPMPAPPTTRCIASIRYVDSGFEVAESLAEAAARSRNPRKQKRKTRQIAVIVKGLAPECNSWSQ